MSRHEFTISSVSDIRGIVDMLSHEDGEERLVDMSMGCQHIRDCADEMGEEWESMHTDCHKIILNGRDAEVFYDENASILSCWCVWVKGIGTCCEPSLEEALYVSYQKVEATK